jgi:NAD(P)H-dependent FMN reductase
MKILAVCGSLQAESSNLALLRKAATLLPAGAVLELFDGVRDLPLFNPDLLVGEPPGPVRRWREALTGSDAVLIASPEYGHSLPGALKNAIDWVIGSGELHRKVVGVTASAPAAGRGLRGLQALCATLRAVEARVVGGEPVERGPAADEELQVLLEAVVEMAGGL